MKLESKDGSSFEMSIPKRIEDESFLRIPCSITTTKGTWTATGTDFELHELRKFADWLEKVGRREMYDEFDFLEPWLLFTYTQDDTGWDVLRIIFDGEYININPPYKGELRIDFQLDEIDLVGTAESLRKYLEKYFKNHWSY